MSRNSFCCVRLRQIIGRGGIFHIRWFGYGGEHDGVYQVVGLTYAPDEPTYIVCSDRWIPLLSVISVSPYADEEPQQ